MKKCYFLTYVKKPLFDLARTNRLLDEKCLKFLKSEKFSQSPEEHVVPR